MESKGWAAVLPHRCGSASTARAAHGLVNELCPAPMPPAATVQWPPGLLPLKQLLR